MTIIYSTDTDLNLPREIQYDEIACFSISLEQFGNQFHYD